MSGKELIEKKVLSYCDHYHMLEKGDHVIVGVSGGADSVCLLFLLHSISRKIPITLEVVHVHHGIRQDADEDAAFTEELCRELEIPFFPVRENVPELAKREGLSVEEAGRRVRYEAFFRHGREAAPGTKGSVKIALAHHMGDRAETLLFHLFRGTGLKGMGSIRPVREQDEEHCRIIRPLLCLERAEIEQYLDEIGKDYRNDSTNHTDHYARNRIRHHILPYAEQEICNGAVRHLNLAAEQVFEAEDYLQQQIKESREVCVEESADGKKGITVKRFCGLHPYLQKRLLQELLNELSPGKKDIGAVHVEETRDLFFGGSGRKKSLPCGIEARREYDLVVLERTEGKPDEDSFDPEEETEIPLKRLADGEKLTVAWGDKSFIFHCIPYKKSDIIPEKNYTKWFDYDKIKGTLLIRTRRAGDFFQIRSGQNEPVRKSLKEYMITEKIPQIQRSSMPLLAEGGHVLWIVGYRISEAYKVDGQTKRILQVSLEDPRAAER